MSAEDQLIGRIARALGALEMRSGDARRLGSRGVGFRRGEGQVNAAGVRVGIGDDAAVIVPGSSKKELVLSCDAFIEGVHFVANRHPADSAGYKALARATSDLAAMGATPRWFLLTLALPESRTGKWLDQFLGGMARAARRFAMALIGGDTTKTERVFVSITVGGEIAPGRAVRRSGARPGEGIYVSGRLGGAQLGLSAMMGGRRTAANRNRVLRSHLYPRIRLELGAWLASERVPSAMIDISDGLSTDLGRLCAASGVGARIWEERIPCVRISALSRGKTAGAIARGSLDPLKLALHGGEDYELLFTVPRRNEKRLAHAPGFAEVRRIGEIVRGGEVLLIAKDGRAKELSPGGWDPFD